MYIHQCYQNKAQFFMLEFLYTHNVAIKLYEATSNSVRHLHQPMIRGYLLVTFFRIREKEKVSAFSKNVVKFLWRSITFQETKNLKSDTMTESVIRSSVSCP